MCVNEKCRKVMVDWLVGVHSHFQLKQQTLFLTINLFDRYCSIKQVYLEGLQLLGITCLWTASKYEGDKTPSLSMLIQMCEMYSKQQVLIIEADLLMCLDFNLHFPSPVDFLERFQEQPFHNDLRFTLSMYLLELSLTETRFYSFKPSCLASAAIFVSLKILNSFNGWNSQMVQDTGNRTAELCECGRYMVILLNYAHQKSHLETIFRKYSDPKFQNVAGFCRNLKR